MHFALLSHFRHLDFKLGNFDINYSNSNKKSKGYKNLRRTCKKIYQKNIWYLILDLSRNWFRVILFIIPYDLKYNNTKVKLWTK